MRVLSYCAVLVLQGRGLDTLIQLLRGILAFNAIRYTFRLHARPQSSFSSRGSHSIDQILFDARAKLKRMTPQEAYNALHDPTCPVPVDIHPAAQHDREGEIRGSFIVERNVLERRFNPRAKRD